MGAANDNARKTPFLIGVAGGTASGKSTVCDRIMEAVIAKEFKMEKQITSLSMDSFYRELNEEELQQAIQGSFNFDHPDAFDQELLLSCLSDIRQGRTTRVPVYDFKKNARVKGEFIIINPSDVILLEGILIFYNKEVRDMFDMKLFVDTDADTRLARRVLRDIEERGRDLEHILHQYTTLVKPAFEEFCFPTKKFADVIIPRGADNTVAISLIVQHICDLRTNNEIQAIRNSRRTPGGGGGQQAGPTRAARRPHFLQPNGSSGHSRSHKRLSSSLSLPEVNNYNEKVCMKSDFLALQTERDHPKMRPPH